MHYVMSDLHGRWDLYSAMLEQIGFSAEDRLYVLGDVADRNCGGIRIFRDILERSNVSLLLGNHEHMLRHAVTAPEERTLNGRETNRMLWYRNGGRVTQEEWDAAPESVRAEILRLIERISLRYHTTIIMVTHNEAIGAMADTVIRLRDGRIRDRVENAVRVPAEQLEW